MARNSSAKALLFWPGKCGNGAAKTVERNANDTRSKGQREGVVTLSWALCINSRKGGHYGVTEQGSG